MFYFRRNIQDVVYNDMLTPQKAVNVEKHPDQLKALHRHLQKYRFSLVNGKCVLILQDNAQPQNPRVAHEAL